MSKEDFKSFVTKSLILIIPCFFLLFWLMLHNSTIFNSDKKELVFHFTNSIPILIVTIVILFIVTKEQIDKAIHQAKTKQKEKDYTDFIKVLKLDNEQLRQLIKEYNITEEKINAIWEEIKDKINLNKLNNLPELAITLIEKIIHIKDEYGVKLKTQITGDISYLKQINITDLKQTIDLMLAPICDHIRNYETEPKRDINLFIREIDNKIMFKTMHDYAEGSINTEMIEWNIKKVLHKYGGSFTVLNEKEEETNMYVLSLIVDIPKEVKVRKIV